MRRDLFESMSQHYRSLLGDRLVGLVLYGSRARGDARPDSDIDLFLLAEGLPADLFERARALQGPRLDLTRDPPVSVRAMTPEEFARDIAPIDLDIAVDGQILFDPTGVVALRLALVRRRIGEAGLVRDQGGVWRWTRFPRAGKWAVTWEGVRT